MLPSSSDLKYFVEVASVLNISRAAERLGISQPSLTLALQRLEHAVGTALLIRSKSGVSLTQSGKQVLFSSRDLIQQWESIKSRAQASVNDVQGIYTLGCHTSVALYSLPLFISDLLEKHPRLELKLVHDLSRKITERVIQLEVDVGIVVNPVRHPDLMITQLCTDEVTFWVGKGQRPTQDFKSGEAVLICDTELIQTQELLKKLKKSGLSFNRILTTSSLEVISALTASGAGVGVLPSRVATREQSSPLKRVPKAPIFTDEVCVIHRVENKNIKAIQHIVATVVKAIK